LIQEFSVPCLASGSLPSLGQTFESYQEETYSNYVCFSVKLISCYNVSRDEKVYLSPGNEHDVRSTSNLNCYHTSKLKQNT